MPDKVDMSLDDIVKLNKKPGGNRGRGGLRRGGVRGGISRGGGLRRGGGGYGGIIKRRSAGGSAKTSPFKAAGKVPDGKWLHDMYSGQGGSAGLRTGPSKIVISNLDFGVNDKDIKDLFEEFGPIRKAAVHYDRSGRSLGTADVLFEKKQDAIKAINKYNGVQLDGRPMTIQFATNSPGVASAGAGAGIRSAGSAPRRGGLFRRGGRGGGGGFRGGRGGGGRRNNNTKPAKTQAELDADLDTYTKMQTD